jgi:hypothetical protein
VVSLTPKEKEPYYPLDRRVDATQIECGCCGEKKNLALLGIEPGLFSP